MSRIQHVKCDLCGHTDTSNDHAIPGWSALQISVDIESSALPASWEKTRLHTRSHVQPNGFGGLRGQDLVDSLAVYERFRQSELCPRCTGILFLMLSKMGTEIKK